MASHGSRSAQPQGYKDFEDPGVITTQLFDEPHHPQYENLGFGTPPKMNSTAKNLPADPTDTYLLSDESSYSAGPLHPFGFAAPTSDRTAFALMQSNLDFHPSHQASDFVSNAPSMQPGDTSPIINPTSENLHINPTDTYLATDEYPYSDGRSHALGFAGSIADHSTFATRQPSLNFQLDDQPSDFVLERSSMQPEDTLSVMNPSANLRAIPTDTYLGTDEYSYFDDQSHLLGLAAPTVDHTAFATMQPDLNFQSSYPPSDFGLNASSMQPGGSHFSAYDPVGSSAFANSADVPVGPYHSYSSPQRQLGNSYTPQPADDLQSDLDFQPSYQPPIFDFDASSMQPGGSYFPTYNPAGFPSLASPVDVPVGPYYGYPPQQYFGNSYAPRPTNILHDPRQTSYQNFMEMPVIAARPSSPRPTIALLQPPQGDQSENLTHVGGIVTPAKVSAGSEKCSIFYCPLCLVHFTRAYTVKSHFPRCIAKNGNPMGLRWHDHPSVGQRRTVSRPNAWNQDRNSHPSRKVAKASQRK